MAASCPLYWSFVEPERTIDLMTKTITPADTSADLDRELEHLRDAAVWQLNAAIEAGWEDAAPGISDSYAADERTLRRRRLRAAA